jgi:hypothetical protein
MILICPECNQGQLFFDYQATYEDYFRTSNYVTDSKGELLEETIQFYLVYLCEKCGKKLRLTFQEVEEMFRKKIAADVLRVKNIMYIKENRELEDLRSSSVMIFCGECDGFDGEGNCPDRFFNRCALRTKAHDIQLP